MSLTCTKSELLEALIVTEKARGAKSNVPHLNGFLFTIQNDQLTINTYDLEMGIEYNLDVNTNYENISIVLPSKILDIIRKLPENELELTVDKENLLINIRSGNAQFELNGLNPEEYPSIPKISSDKTFSIPQNNLKTMISQTNFAISRDETKPAFTGILMSFNDNNLDMVATDSFRLAWKKGNIINNNNIEGDYIVPAKVLSQISKIIGDEEKDLTLFISNEYIIFETEKIRIFSKLINEKFPNLEQVIPKNYQTLVKIEKDYLLDAMERASLLASEGASNIIKLKVEEDKLIITSNSPTTGKLHENMDIKKEGDNIDIAINVKFMIEVLRALEEKMISIEFSGSYSPLMLKSSRDYPYLHLILPVRAL